MVTQMKEEYLAAGIREQTSLLKSLSEELEIEKLPADVLAWRLKAVEMQLRRLREAA